MKIKTKNAKNGVTSTVNLALHKDLILKTPKAKREVRLIREMEFKNVTYGETSRRDSKISFLEPRANSLSLQIFISLFTIYIGSKIW